MATFTLTLVVANTTISFIVIWINDVPRIQQHKYTININNWTFFIFFCSNHFCTELSCLTSSDIIFINSVYKNLSFMIYEHYWTNHKKLLLYISFLKISYLIYFWITLIWFFKLFYLFYICHLYKFIP